MNYLLRILILAIIGGIIGYITNVVAIKLIFRPIKPIKVPILNIEILGLIPKRRNEIAKNIGEVIENELISVDEILENIITEEDKESVVTYIKAKMKVIISEKIPFIPGGIKNIIEGYIGDILEDEIRQSIDDLSKDIVEKASNRINIQQIIEEKINEFDLEKLEEIIISISKRELKQIEFLGLVLGFGIGLIQGLITIFI